MEVFRQLWFIIFMLGFITLQLIPIAIECAIKERKERNGKERSKERRN